MHKQKKNFGKTAQSIMEYALLTAAIAAAFAAMQLYLQRAVQAKLKIVQDQMNQPVVIINPTP